MKLWKENNWVTFSQHIFTIHFLYNFLGIIVAYIINAVQPLCPLRQTHRSIF